ncbi:MAG: hypothetical protein U9Q58_08330 [Pseudomonadota bacterium]|nr:hypothetical protein [Pseudomonadota bacterium]
MKIRLIIMLLVLLVILQIGLLGRGRKADVRLLKAELANLESSARQLRNKELSYNKELRYYRQIIATIPPSVLMGFEDPEAVFAAFLDFLNAESLADVEAKVVMRRQLQFVKKPVPLRASDFNFQFTFTTVAEAETFLDYLLEQPNYPLRVNRLKINSAKGQGRVSGGLAVSLMIPDKLMLAGRLAGEE